MLRLYLLCLISTIVVCKKHHHHKDDSRDESSDSNEGPDYIPHIETTLDLRGNIRRLLVVELGLESDGRNLICSPLSAMIPLAKLLLGASGNSKTELLEAVGLESTTDIKGTFKQVLKEIEYLKGVEISLASRIYHSRKDKLLTKFKHLSHKIFGSSIELVDFTRPEQVAGEINKWVSDHTKRKIQDIIKPADIMPDSSLISVNAIYFKGRWERPFQPAVKEKFYSPKGPINAWMMNRKGDFNYYESRELNAQLLELPYHGDQSAMLIILPNAKNGLPILLQTLRTSYDLLNIAIISMRKSAINVTIPKFKIEASIDLMSYFRQLGISSSLNSITTGLKNIVKDKKIHISQVTQRAIIEVDEKGTEAAAATATVTKLSAIRRIEFLADRPFLFYVRAMHEQLFAGVVSNPEVE